MPGVGELFDGGRCVADASARSVIAAVAEKRGIVLGRLSARLYGRRLRGLLRVSEQLVGHVNVAARARCCADEVELVWTCRSPESTKVSCRSPC
jgi:hypothetical protein